MTWSVLNGDCLERLADLDDDSIDAVVTDPPYGLSAEPDATEVMRHWLEGDDYQHRGGGFMGKSWDSFVPGPTVWKECLRVLKPGGHLVAFFGTRTVDLGGMAIRLAGFEIRDCLAWHYGSGFPKSLNVSKAIDKAAGAEREVVRTAISPATTAGKGFSNEEDERPWMTEARERGYHEHAGPAPATDLARQWQGWGTALKPAFEPIILARKPLIGTVAENVTRYGTGALNVDGCRVGSDGGTRKAEPAKRGSVNAYGDGLNGGGVMPIGDGRWPANLVLDDQAAAMLDEQSGESTSTAHQRGLQHSGRHGGLSDKGPNLCFGTDGIRGLNDTGGASRFFYQAKASRAERNAGLDDPLPNERFRTRRCTACQKNVPEAGACGCDADIEWVEPQPTRNPHPTVKPIDLMRWLVRLVTPPGGTVLDPFTGSGTTGIAAGLEGFEFVGIEREAEYREIAEARLRWWGEQEGETAEILQRAGLAEKERAKAEAAGQTSLFEEAA